MVITLFIGVFLLTSAAFLKPNWLYVLLSFISFGAFFNVLSGNWIQYALFILGVILLIVEFYIPGFGIAGVLGIMGTSFSMYLYGLSIIEILIFAGLSLVVILMTSFMYSKMGKSMTLSPGLILNTSLHKEDGFSASEDLSHLLDQKGTTLTALRPVGRASFGDEIYDVMSDMGMINSNTSVYVTRIEGSKIYVRGEQ